MLIVTENFVKQKWRNLRDQFQREIKKVIVPFDNPTKPYIHYYRGKWIYFEQMLFLRDISAKISNTCYSPPADIEINDDDIIKEELVVFDDSGETFDEQANVYENLSENYEKEPSVTSIRIEDNQNLDYQLLIQPKIEIVEEVQPEDKGIKRHVSETKSEPVVPSKVKKITVVDASSNTEDNGDIDDDLHFVKSLVPYLRKLSPIRKLLVRNEIQSLLIRESLCENCKFQKSTAHNL